MSALTDVFALGVAVLPEGVKRRVIGRGERRAYPIHAYVGSNGGGKSLAAVWDTIPSLRSGRPVLSTVRLLDFENPRPCDDESCTSEDHARHLAAHPLWVPFTEPKQLLEAEHCDVIMDEVTGVASSRESNSMPPAVANALVQLRRRDVVLRWTTPNWRRADTIIRECTQAATICRGFLPQRVDVGPDEEERAWRQRRLFKWSTYDAADLDDFTAGKRAQLKPYTVDFHYGPGSVAFSAYDTFDAVLSLLAVSDFGTCLECGGHRRRPSCSCSDRPARASRSVASARAPLAGAPLAADDEPAQPSRQDSTAPALSQPPALPVRSVA